MSEPCRSRRGEGYEARDDEKQDKTRRRLRLRAVTAARSAGRFQGFYGQEEDFSELFGNFRRVSHQASLLS